MPIRLPSAPSTAATISRPAGRHALAAHDGDDAGARGRAGDIVDRHVELRLREIRHRPRLATVPGDRGLGQAHDPCTSRPASSTAATRRRQPPPRASAVSGVEATAIRIEGIDAESSPRAYPGRATHRARPDRARRGVPGSGQLVDRALLRALVAAPPQDFVPCGCGRR